jgi:hypothetical protein
MMDRRIKSKIAQLELSDLNLQSKIINQKAERVGPHSTVGKQKKTSTWLSERVLVLFSKC